MFRLEDIKIYSTSELIKFKALAILSQGNGHQFSKMLENRINKISVELSKRD